MCVICCPLLGWVCPILDKQDNPPSPEAVCVVQFVLYCPEFGNLTL